MVSSDAAAEIVNAAPGKAAPLDWSGSSDVPGSQRFVWFTLAFALVVPWWLPVSSQPVATFYKEWLVVVAFAFSGLIAGPRALPLLRAARPHPLVFATLACIVVLALQALLFDGALRKSALMSFAAAFFAFMVVYGRSVRERGGEASMEWIAKCLAIAALGSCVFALLQYALPGLPGVLPRVGRQLFGNVGQSNHFADLLWIGCVATAFLYSRRILSARSAVPLVVTMLAFATTSGSRSAWLYAGALVVFGALCRFRRPHGETQRFGVTLIGVVLIYVMVTVIVSSTGALDALGVSSAEQRVANGAAEESTSQRLWFWRVGAQAVLDHPLLGVGAGRFPGEGLSLAMRVADSPKAAADAQAHNFFVQLAAECGAPLALLVAVCLVVWLYRTWRASAVDPSSAAALALALPILIHANVEHPLGYLYFLGLLGLLVGQVAPDTATATKPVTARASPELLRYASFAIIAAAALGYVHYVQVERAMQSVLAQVRIGAAPQPSQDLNGRLAAVSSWSAFGDYAELISLLSAMPTTANAKALAQRCERALALGPSPQLLARCATALQVDGQAERASYFANSLCKIFPASAGVLIQSMSLVEPVSPAAANVRSTCVQRAP